MDEVSQPDTKRHRYQFLGTLPQWVGVLLLTIIGILTQRLWDGMDSRVKALEEAKAIYAVEIATLKQQTHSTIGALSKLEASQTLLGSLTQQLVVELRIMQAQRNDLKPK